MKRVLGSLRELTAIAMILAPISVVGACSGTELGDADTDAGTSDAGASDGSVTDADSSIDAAITDARSDGAAIKNACGGYGALTIDGKVVEPGSPCGACGEGTIACVGADTVECAEASPTACPDASTFDAGLNACGGFGPLTFLSADAGPNDSCGDCAQLHCATTTTLVCVEDLNACPPDASTPTPCSIPDTAYAATPSYPTLPAETRPDAGSSTTISLPTLDLAFNPRDGFLYASIEGTVSQGNAIAVIDPMTAQVVDSIYLGVNPTQLAISDDGEVLWVATTNPGTLQRVDLLTRTLGTKLTFPMYVSATDVQVLPGSHDSVAVITDSLVIFDGAIPRPYGLTLSASALETTPSSSLLYAGYSAALFVACLNASGAFPVPFAYQGADYYADINSVPVFSTGKLYAFDGDVFDAKTGAALGAARLSKTGPSQAVTRDSMALYFLWVDEGVLPFENHVSAVDPTSLSVLGDDVIDQDGYNTTSAAFTRWGRYGLAFIDASRAITIVRTPVIPDAP